MAVRVRRLLASALALLLTGAPVAAATCALACPMPATATQAPGHTAAGDMPADCAALHHDATATTLPAVPADTPVLTSLSGADSPCCALIAAPAEAPRAFATNSPQAMAALAPAADAVALDVTAVRAPAHAPPAPGPIGRARRTDILRL